MSNPHADGTENYKQIIDHNGPPIYIHSQTEGNSTSSNISRISKKYKIQATVTFKSGTFAVYEEFKRTMRNMSKILDWDTEQFGKEIFLSLAGKAAESINDMSMDDLCNADKVFEKLEKTFLPKNRTVLEEFHSMKLKNGNKLSEFYEDMKVAYNKARPHAVMEIVEDLTTTRFVICLKMRVQTDYCMIYVVYNMFLSFMQTESE